MKRILTLAIAVFSFYGIANAQFAGEYDLAKNNGDNSSYNRVGISYNNDGYSFNNIAKYLFSMDKGSNSLNGFGIDYVHGFNISFLPMFIEVGGNVNFNFGTLKSYDWEDDDYGPDYKMTNINLQVPVNYVYRFNINDSFSIAPYVGLNFKLHLMSKISFDEGDESVSLFSKDDMGEDATWNRFQMGWHVGVGFQYEKINLGVQYGTDFIPAFKYSEDGITAKVNTSSLKISLGYCF